MRFRQAIVAAMTDEMTADESVIFFGEDVGRAGGVFKVTPGLYEKYGALRVRDTPISETAIVGAGIGASHQTGWTGIVAVLIEELARNDVAEPVAKPKAGKKAVVVS